MNHSDENLLEMARDAYVAAENCLGEGDFEALETIMAVRDQLMEELTHRFDGRMVSKGCNDMLNEVQVAEARFVERLEATMTQLQSGLENRRRNKSKVRKYAP